MKRLLQVTLGLLAIAALSLVFFRREPVAPIETPRTELTLRKGRLYRADDSRPFTGIMTDAYADGAIASRTEILDGKLHGVSRGWHTNGELQVVEHFANGASHGLRSKWRDDGSKLSETEIVQGIINGAHRAWHENGALAEEISMTAGKPDGVAQAFFPSGYLKSFARMSNGAALERKTWQDNETKVAN